MARVCTCCTHPDRATIDRIIAAGSSTVRGIAERFGISPTAVHRHHDHVRRSVAVAVQRQQQARDAKLASRWVARLDSAYEHAESGMSRTGAAGPEGWEAGSRFIGNALKAIELGLKADGVIDGGRGGATTNNTQYVIALPRGPVELPIELPDAIEVSAIESDTSDEDDTES